MLLHCVLQVHQRIRVRCRQVTAEEGVVTVIDHVHVTPGGVQDGLQAGQAHAEHRIQHNPQPPFPDRVGIHLPQDGIQVGVPRINNNDFPLGLCRFKIHAADFSVFQTVGSFLDGFRHVLGSVPSAGCKQLDTVPDGRVMTGRHHGAVRQLSFLHRKHNLGCRAAHVDKVNLHAFTRQDLAEPDQRLAAEEPPVIPDAKSFFRAAFLLHSPGQRRRHPPDIVPGKSVSDNGSPAACAELNHLVPPFRCHPSSCG